MNDMSIKSLIVNSNIGTNPYVKYNSDITGL